MRALRFYGRQDIRLDDIDEPQCGPGQVKVRPAVVGICGSDIHEYLEGPIVSPALGPRPITGESLPITLGHEFSGIVEEVGPGVTKFNVGNRVAIKPNLYDGTCINCQRGRFNCCLNVGLVGYSGTAGGLADHVVVSEKNAIPLPDDFPLDIGAMVEPLAIAWHAVERGSVKEGDTVFVAGAGPVGLAIVLILRMRGVSNIIVSEIALERKRFAKVLGAASILDPTHVDIAEEVGVITSGRGADVAFEVSGVQAGLDAAIASIKVRGTTVMVAMWAKKPVIDFNHIVGQEKHVTGTVLYDDGEFEAVIQAIHTGKLDPRPMITGSIALEETEERGFQALINEKDKHVKILVDVST